MKSEVVVEEGGMTLVRHTVPAGFDSSPHYRGLPEDMCPCEHWCSEEYRRKAAHLAAG